MPGAAGGADAEPGTGGGLGGGDSEALQAAARDMSRQCLGGFVGGAGAGFALAVLGQGVRSLQDFRRVGVLGRAQGALVGFLAGSYLAFLRLDGALEPNLERLISRDTPLGAEAAQVLAELAPGHPLLRSAPRVEALDGRKGLSGRAGAGAGAGAGVGVRMGAAGAEVDLDAERSELSFRQRLKAAMTEAPGPQAAGGGAAEGGRRVPVDAAPEAAFGAPGGGVGPRGGHWTPGVSGPAGDLGSGDIFGFLGGGDGASPPRHASPDAAPGRAGGPPRRPPSTDDRARRSQRVEEILERRRRRSEASE